MALVTLWLSSMVRLQQKSLPLCPWRRVCVQSHRPWSLLRGLMDVRSGAGRGRLIPVDSGLQGWLLPLPERRVTAGGWPLGVEWQRMRWGCPAAVPSAWPPRAGTAPWASWTLLAFLCSIGRDYLSGLLWSSLARLLPAAHAPRRWPLVPCSGGEQGVFFPQGWLAVVPGFFFAFLCSIEHGPLPGLLWAVLASCLLAALAPRRHHSGPGSLWFSLLLQVCSGSNLWCSLGSIYPGVLAWAKQPVLGRAPGLLHHFSALPACNTSLGQARERFSCIAGQEA